MSEVLKREMDPIESTESRVVLQFRRHGKKEKTLEGQADKDVSLTKEGREQAVSVGKELNPQAEVSVAMGSPRRRAQEVASRAMLANEAAISSDMTLEEINAEIAKELEYGKKISEDRRLDFYEKHGSKLKELTDEAYAAKRTAEFTVHDSDRIAQETKDLESSTYIRLAGQVAELVKKYAEVARNFQRVVASNPEKYREFHNQMERYFGTHNTVSDSFVARVIEKQEGVAVRDEFLAAVGPLGFKEAEGFTVDITNRGHSQEIVMRVKVKDQEWNVSIQPKTLDQLIRDREVFDQEIANS